MAVLEHEVRSAEARLTDLRRHLFTREEYYGLAEILGDKRVELIEGEIIEMAPFGDFHASVTHPLAVILEEAFGEGFCARNQVPIALGEDFKPSDPQPDVAIVAGTWRDYAGRHPAAVDVKLIVEVADSSLRDDRGIKAKLYGSAGIPEYWIVNLVDRQIEVYREPCEAGYRSVTKHRVGDRVKPLLASGDGILVADFLA
jgi:Uma2 family endonuclease